MDSGYSTHFVEHIDKSYLLPASRAGLIQHHTTYFEKLIGVMLMIFYIFLPFVQMDNRGTARRGLNEGSLKYKAGQIYADDELTGAAPHI